MKTPISVRLKIEHTPEYQAEYTRRGFSEKDKARLIETVRREVHPVVDIVRSGVPHIRTENHALFPISFYEVAETGECCMRLLKK